MKKASWFAAFAVVLVAVCGIPCAQAWAAGSALTTGTVATDGASPLQTMADDSSAKGYAEIPDNPQAIALGEKKTVTLTKEEEVVTFSFTPKSEGDFYFTSEGNEDTKGCVLTADELIDKNDDYSYYEEDENFRAYFHGKSGVTYYLQTMMRDTGSFTVKVAEGTEPIGFAHISGNPPALTIGEKQTVEIKNAGDVATLAFVPKESGLYYASTFAEGTGSQICLMTKDELLGHSDFYGQFANMINFYAEAGVTYYLQAMPRKFEDTPSIEVEVSACNDWADREYGQIAGVPLLVLDSEGWLVEDSDGNYLVNPNLPEGVDYDLASDTLTLTNYKADFAGTDDANCYLLLGTSTKIVLNGENTFSGMTVSWGGGIRCNGELRISGSGSLTMDFSKTPGSMHGIEAKNIIVDDATLNIVGGDNPKQGAFYGMTMVEPWSYCYKFKNARDYFHVVINNAKVNISNTCSNDYEVEGYGLVDVMNIGIDSQDSDLVISNSEVNIAMTGGITWGIGSGLEKYDSFYGGKFSVDDKSHVTVKLLDTCTKYKELGYVWSLYCAEEDVRSPYIYVANPDGTRKLADNAALHKHVGYEKRNECTDTYLELSPKKIDDTSAVMPVVEPDNPEPVLVKGDVTGDGEVAMNDILKINSYLLKRIQLSDAELAAADVTGDGAVAMNDILKINSYLLKRISSL